MVYKEKYIAKINERNDFVVLLFADMAPMTGGIAYGEKDWLIFRFCFFKRFIIPRKPVYLVMSVLKWVGGSHGLDYWLAYLLTYAHHLPFIVWIFKIKFYLPPNLLFERKRSYIQME